MANKENMLRIIALALSHKVLPVPSIFSNNTIHAASSKSITSFKAFTLRLNAFAEIY
jgi:hypothetical protein